ncbi:MAG: pentapeptide repeat-containing protein, partial [Longimicrobiales bacterium]
MFNCFLRNANLTRTNFAGATLRNVDFEGAT